uniref:Uncharacterized protein n=1 Tax=viral metagenome TaxID=1070528 RepID=A0A6C0K000_9ZZZZ
MAVARTQQEYDAHVDAGEQIIYIHRELVPIIRYRGRGRGRSRKHKKSHKKHRKTRRKVHFDRI